MNTEFLLEEQAQIEGQIFDLCGLTPSRAAYYAAFEFGSPNYRKLAGLLETHTMIEIAIESQIEEIILV